MVFLRGVRGDEYEVRNEEVHRIGLFNCKQTGVKLTASKLNLLYFVFKWFYSNFLTISFCWKGKTPTVNTFRDSSLLFPETENLNRVFTNIRKILKETLSKKMAIETYELATKIFGLVAGRLLY